MNALTGLHERLRKIEALVEGAVTPAERSAAEAARARVQAQLEAEALPSTDDELVLDLSSALQEQ
jgi:hypothetical protein